MILNDHIKITVNNKNLKYYRNLINSDINSKDIIEININDLPFYSKFLIDVSCDECESIQKIRYSDYKKITNNLQNKYYCKKCKHIKTKETNLKKYGVENVFQNDAIKEKIKQTNFEKYGVEHYSKTEEYSIKTKNTCLEKYGVNHPLQNEKILKKLEKTNIEKYGVKCTLMNDEIKLKIINTNIEKYGVEIPLKNKEIISKLIDTNLKKYDNKSPLLNSINRKKSLTKLFENYGVYNPLKSETIKDKVQKTRVKNLLQKYSYINIISISGDTYTFKCDCGNDHEFEIQSGLLYHRLKYKTKLCTVCNEINSHNNSGFQIELGEFIKNNCDFSIIKNDRIIINPHELDFYIPDLKLAFEFNGLYWHNELYKTSNYHYIKTEACEKKDIQLIHIYEDDWLYKKDIVKSRILNLLGKSKRIYARKCKISEITDNQLTRNFLNTNHIQGFIGSKVKLGLFYNEELVSIMTFGNLRKRLGQKSKIGSYELLRFNNKLNTNVVGGASKLFNYFIKNYSPDEIISYADRSWSTGNLYRKIGFTLEHKTKPNYYYIIDNTRKHRFAYRKNNNYDNLGKTEQQIMIEKKIYRIYDSGSLKFKWKKSMINKYRVEYAAQLEDFYNKMIKNGYLVHKYEDIYYQGEYELDFLQKYYNIGIQRGPTIKYVFNDTEHIYYSDFYFKKMNLIIEIKSKRWYNEHLEKNKAKEKACIEQGYNFIIILDKDYSIFEEIVKHISYDKNHCWQYDVKLNLSNERNKYENLKVKHFTFEYIAESDKKGCKEIREFIEKYEWLGKMPNRPTHRFVAKYNNEIGGAVIMATPNSFSKLIDDEYDNLEKLISRGANAPWTPKNLSSSLIMWAIKWMVKNTDFRLFTAYSDTEAKELGTIYQACNFIYLGQKYGGEYLYFDINKSHLGWFSNRNFRRRNIYNKIAKELSIPVSWKKVSDIPKEIKKILDNEISKYKKHCIERKTPPKHKYLYILGKDKRETKILIKKFYNKNPKLIGLNYPKIR